ncbi:hypothetical protein WH47_04209 [Habropoda laboriosa]|uniref:Uncharacterized protein n=1 Tax=Habropoda laboriosa TaxID=597456 RepID=A0A0L7QV77_9HYME|nr:hypothetical protein WH47_04209 [Habropoda laboriosa]
MLDRFRLLNDPKTSSTTISRLHICTCCVVKEHARVRNDNNQTEAAEKEEEEESGRQI